MNGDSSGINTTLIANYTTGSNGIIGVINSYLVPALITVALIVFLWGVANAYILHPGDETRRSEGHKLILWGIIGFVVILSVWGLVNLLTTLFGLTPGGTSPALPTIQTGQ